MINNCIKKWMAISLGNNLHKCKNYYDATKSQTETGFIANNQDTLNNKDLKHISTDI